MTTRRRFLAISAAAAVAGLPMRADARSWRGIALGAEAQITLRGPRALIEPALAAAQAEIAAVEETFSLYRDSALTRLNAAGRLIPMPARFADLARQVPPLHSATEGLFDPTVQALWQAHAEGRAPDPSRFGWDKVQITDDTITLGRGQNLTFNGIAQGHATDRVRAVLAAHGFTEALVNIGEFSGRGDWRIGVADPDHGLMFDRRLTNGAIATSSPAATRIAGRPHILHPRAEPVWSTVSVEAADATTADALSTALVLASRDQAKRIAARLPSVNRVTLIDTDGNIRTL